MPTEVIRIDRERDYWQCIRRAAGVIRDGGLVGFPTETVYGVGVRADRGEAVAALRHAKHRDAEKPFTVHIGQPDHVHRFVPEMTGLARRFVRKAWPGPVTFVFPVEDPSSAEVVQGSGPDQTRLIYHQGTVGIRCPAEKVAADLLTEVDVPVVAASANLAGRQPSRSADGVVEALDGEIDLVLDGGESQYAKPSTVVMLNGSGYRVLREGVIDERTLRRFGSLLVLFVCSGNTCRSPMAAAMFRRLIAERLACAESSLADRNIYVESAGAGCVGGSPASAGAVKAMSDRGITLSGHVSRPLSVESIHRADEILCMTRSHVDSVVQLLPAAAEKTFLLSADGDIEDPFGASAEAYASCAKSMDQALQCRAAELSI